MSAAGVWAWVAEHNPRPQHTSHYVAFSSDADVPGPPAMATGSIAAEPGGTGTLNDVLRGADAPLYPDLSVHEYEGGDPAHIGWRLAGHAVQAWLAMSLGVDIDIDTSASYVLSPDDIAEHTQRLVAEDEDFAGRASQRKVANLVELHIDVWHEFFDAEEVAAVETFARQQVAPSAWEGIQAENGLRLRRVVVHQLTRRNVPDLRTEALTVETLPLPGYEPGVDGDPVDDPHRMLPSRRRLLHLVRSDTTLGKVAPAPDVLSAMLVAALTPRDGTTRMSIAPTVGFEKYNELWRSVPYCGKEGLRMPPMRLPELHDAITDPQRRGVLVVGGGVEHGAYASWLRALSETAMDTRGLATTVLLDPAALAAFNASLPTHARIPAWGVRVFKPGADLDSDLRSAKDISPQEFARSSEAVAERINNQSRALQRDTSSPGWVEHVMLLLAFRNKVTEESTHAEKVHHEFRTAVARQEARALAANTAANTPYRDDLDPSPAPRRTRSAGERLLGGASSVAAQPQDPRPRMDTPKPLLSLGAADLATSSASLQSAQTAEVLRARRTAQAQEELDQEGLVDGDVALESARAHITDSLAEELPRVVRRLGAGKDDVYALLGEVIESIAVSAFLRYRKALLATERLQISEEIREEVAAALRPDLEAQVRAELTPQLKRQLTKSITRDIEASVRDDITATIREEERTQARQELLDELVEQAAEVARSKAEAAVALAVEQQRALLEATIADLSDERDEVEEDLRRAREEVRWLRRELHRVQAHAEASAPVPEETFFAPASFAELMTQWEERLTPLGVVFTGDPAVVRGLDSIDAVGKNAALAWTILEVLADFVAARAAGEVHGSVHLYLSQTPPGYRTISSAKHAPGESETTMSMYGDQRVFPVPVDVDPSGYATMGAHFKLHKRGIVSPRIHYFDDTANTGKVYVGYIGEHLRTVTTN